MKTRLIIARHGNTFRPGETPTRVGAKTDLPLVESVRGNSIGKYLKEKKIVPDTVYASPLLRATQTAQLAIEAMEVERKILILDDFIEIDYGPDENKTEEEVMIRLGAGDPEKGKAIIDGWNKDATVPEGWQVDPQKIIDTWIDFANNQVMKKHKGETTLLVTSNGIIRFAPYLTEDFKKFTEEHDIKVTTGGVCIFEKEENDLFWTCTGWNIKPYKL